MKKYITIPKIIKARQLKEDRVVTLVNEETMAKTGEWYIDDDEFPTIENDKSFRKKYLPLDENEKGFSKLAIILVDFDEGKMLSTPIDEDTIAEILPIVIKGFAEKLINRNNSFYGILQAFQRFMGEGLTGAFSEAYQKKESK